MRTGFASITLSFIALIGAASAAAQSNVDFEGLPDGTVLTTQYPGLTFQNAIILTVGISLNEFEFPPHSGINIASDNGGLITIAFAVPVTSFSGYFTYATRLTLTAFDAGNHQVAQAASLFANNEAISGVPGSSPNELIQVSFAGGIASVTIGGVPGGDSFTFDDATYASVPTLGSLPDAFQIRYASNLGIGDSVVNVTNTGASATVSAGTGGFAGGNLCINAYVFDQSEELLACCACLVTPNGLASFSVKSQLVSNNLSSEIPNSAVVKLLATTPGTATSATGCNAASPTAATLAPGMRAWGTTLHAQPTMPTRYGLTETPFSISTLSQGELNHLTSFCGFIQSNGSGFGICKGCSTGGLGATRQ